MVGVIRQARFRLLVLAIIVFSSSCAEGPPAFERGIRFMSFYDVVDTPPPNPIFLMTVPSGAVIVSGILNFGDITSRVGPPSPGSGSDVSFAGETDRFGISDHKDIIDNAFWNIQANYLNIVPGCGVRQTSFKIPPGGQQIFAVCYIGN